VASYIGAIDQGTTSSRFIVFDRAGRIVSTAQREHEQIYPKPGWVEHDAEEIWRRTQDVMQEAMEMRGLRASDLAAIGITNQRETTVVWHKRSGKPVCNAIVWQDRRTAAFCREHKVVYQGFSLLTANQEVLRHPPVIGLAQGVNATVAQLVFAFAKAVGMLPLTGTSDPEHMREDLASTSLELSQEAVTALERIAS
jgi:diketogulonate reductase-like aldo/keto reductase